jgi:hypothetical protein
VLKNTDTVPAGIADLAKHSRISHFTSDEQFVNTGTSAVNKRLQSPPVTFHKGGVAQELKIHIRTDTQTVRASPVWFFSSGGHSQAPTTRMLDAWILCFIRRSYGEKIAPFTWPRRVSFLSIPVPTGVRGL